MHGWQTVTGVATWKRDSSNGFSGRKPMPGALTAKDRGMYNRGTGISLNSGRLMMGNMGEARRQAAARRKIQERKEEEKEYKRLH